MSYANDRNNMFHVLMNETIQYKEGESLPVFAAVNLASDRMPEVLATEKDRIEFGIFLCNVLKNRATDSGYEIDNYTLRFHAE